MDIFDEEILKFWKCLQDSNVRYIMVGDFAMTIHGNKRFTPVINMWIEDSLNNRGNLRKAFNDVGMGDIFMIETMQFVAGWTDFQLNNSLKLDIIVNMKGLEEFTFDESLQVATIAEIDNIKVPFLHIDQLIANKKAVNRPQDQLDVIELEKIKLLRNEMGLD